MSLALVTINSIYRSPRQSAGKFNVIYVMEHCSLNLKLHKSLRDHYWIIPKTLHVRSPLLQIKITATGLLPVPFLQPPKRTNAPFHLCPQCVSGRLRAEKQVTKPKPRFGFDKTETEPKPRFFRKPSRNRTVIQNIETADHYLWLA